LKPLSGDILWKRSRTWIPMRPAWRMSANSREDLRTIILALHVFDDDGHHASLQLVSLHGIRPQAFR